MIIPEGLEEFAEDCIPTGLKVISFKARPARGMRPDVIDIEVEYEAGETFWITNAPLHEVHTTKEGSLWVFKMGSMKLAMVGASI